MRTQPRRLVSAAVAVVLGVAFLTLALLVGDSLRATLSRGAVAAVGGASVVVTPAKGTPGLALDAPDTLRRLPGVTAVRTEVAGQLEQDLPGRTGFLYARSTPRLSDTTTLAAGRLPAAPSEVAVNEVAASSRSLTVDTDLRLLTNDDTPVTVRLVGVVRSGAEVSQTAGLPQLYAADPDLLRWLGSPGYAALYVTAPGATDTLLDAVRAAVPGATVRTGDAEVTHRAERSTQGVQELTALFGAFGVVALFVAALVITNTFAILVAQKTRQLALLRCVGATRAQVFRGVVTEAALVGTVGSAAGVALGVAGMAALVASGGALGLPLSSLGVAPGSLVAPFVAGVLLTVAASLLPARRATAVAPLAALRPQPVDAGRRTGRVRLVVGALLFAAGAALLVLGSVTHSLAFGVPGGFLNFAGVLVTLPVVAPAVAGLFGAGARGTTGRLAVGNSRRNPGRAAATSGALLVGVALITMLGVGAETGRASIDAQFARDFPADVTVSPADALPPAAFERLATTPGVAAWTPTLNLGLDRTGGDPFVAVALGPDAARVVRDTNAVAGLADGVLLVPTDFAREGQELTLTAGDRTLTVRAHVTGGLQKTPVLTLADAHRLAPDAPVGALVRFDDRADAAATTEALADRVAEVAPGVEVVGLAAMRQEMQKMIDTVLLIAVGLLGVAVVIAVVGVGNTLGLSVVERTQETGLLRALGLTRAQVRGMLGVEAVTLAGVAVVLGLLLGAGYGVAGILAVMGETVPVVVSIPWLRLGLVAVVALGAGWLASVVPAARAAKVSPAAALAYE